MEITLLGGRGEAWTAWRAWRSRGAVGGGGVLSMTEYPPIFFFLTCSSGAQNSRRMCRAVLDKNAVSLLRGCCTSR